MMMEGDHNATRRQSFTSNRLSIKNHLVKLGIISDKDRMRAERRYVVVVVIIVVVGVVVIVVGVHGRVPSRRWGVGSVVKWGVGEGLCDGSHELLLFLFPLV